MNSAATPRSKKTPVRRAGGATSGLVLTRVHPYRWLVLLGLGVVGAYCVLGGWMYHWQVREHDRFKSISAGNIASKSYHVGRRGRILDSRGAPLADSKPVKTVCADPSLIFTGHDLVAQALAPFLEMSEAEIREKIAPTVRTNRDGQLGTNAFVVLKHKVSLETWEKITNTMSRLDLGLAPARRNTSRWHSINSLQNRSIFARDGYRRQYPNGKLAAHVLGFAVQGEVSNQFGQAYPDCGAAGIEARFDQVLSGVDGWASRQSTMAARRGMNVVLTIDAAIQSIVEEELAAVMSKFSPRSATAIVVRPSSGEVRELANAPTFDPNRPGASPEGYFNHAIQSLTEPGSTFKIVTIATALHDGLIGLDDTIHCENGAWLFGKRYLHDHHSYGILTYRQVVSKSSNIGTAKTAVKLGPERLYNTITNFGFGALTQIPLTGESAGYIHPPARWSGLSISRIPIGHEVAATPLQMVMAMSAVANRGRLMRPVLVSRLEDDEGNVVARFGAETLRNVISERASAQMVDALKTVVSEEGTANLARLEHYTVAGKTGTTEKFVNGTYKSGRYYASFVGFFPADRPELCIMIGVDEPNRRVGHFGGVVAAPVFQAIAERAANYLRLTPENPGEVQPGRSVPKEAISVAQGGYADVRSVERPQPRRR